ncbi:MAG: hypothetical protein A2015_02995 [Spirochaetes bacterium GWF1_31_7]|nr:MAG: hypothetical protein A2Y29_01600 [Spirochaetes bacterium GWE2_31_10]OHD49208.1 MAG: hypothetical protein A2015_02995 [Spirochaetes bacterium GWF1_31_7]OHD82005.1 MAG: hypothetical protein A2355_18470 [Spirochaetes bacterium RIFOXYB1_FULL_32_8]HBD95700.1 hypothetical protein [Spirochaetia bacterium]HBI37038.1 hypothetical protein [Spirochaetia bacterium]
MGVFAQIKKAGTQTRFDIINNEIDTKLVPIVEKFILSAEKKIYENFNNRFLSQKEIDVIKSELTWSMTHAVDDIIKNTGELSATLFAAQGIQNSKTLQTLINYTANGFGGDMADMLLSVKGQTERALNHISYTFGMQNQREFRNLYNELKNFKGDDIKKNLESFQRVFSDEYGKRFLNEMTKNPILNSLIKQENGSLFFYNKNGRRYDIEKYKKAWGNYMAIDVMRKAQATLAKDNGLEVFRFDRVRDVVEPRDHSIHQGEYFTTNLELVGKEINGKIIQSDIISDFHISGEPPHGCGHLYIAVRLESESENIQENDKKDENNEKNNENSGIIKKELSFKKITDKNVLGAYKNVFDNSNSDIKNVLSKYSDELIATKGKGNFYAPGTNTITHTKDGLDGYTIPHEIGHFVDNICHAEKYGDTLHKYWNYSYDKHWSIDGHSKSSFQIAMEKAIDDINGRTKEAIELRKIIDTDMKQSFTEIEMGKKEFSAVQDVFNGITRGKLKYRYMHSDKYWKDIDAPYSEVFAHLFRLYTNKGQVENDRMLDFIKRYIPDVVKSFEDFINNGGL